MVGRQPRQADTSKIKVNSVLNFIEVVPWWSHRIKRAQPFPAKPLILLVPQGGIEPPTY